jgi:hypothetical protein
MSTFNYNPKSERQLKNWFSAKKKKSKISFKVFEDFKEWYDNQDKKCHYCGLTEQESQELVMTGKLKSKRFPENGALKRGKNRGIFLEIDRKDSNKNYSKDNCVLACYFCNNDKSDLFDAEEYKKFFQDRANYLKKIIK